MVVSPKELLALTEKCFRSFNANVATKDGHVVAFFAAENVTDEAATMFVRQVFFGCQRYLPLLQEVVNAYLVEFHRMKSDEVKFLLLAYLALIRLDDLSLTDFKYFCIGLFQHDVAAEFLGFLFNVELFQAKCVPLLHHYGDNFIQRILLEYIRDHAASMGELVGQFNTIAKGAGRDLRAAPAAMACHSEVPHQDQEQHQQQELKLRYCKLCCRPCTEQALKPNKKDIGPLMWWWAMEGAAAAEREAVEKEWKRRLALSLERGVPILTSSTRCCAKCISTSRTIPWVSPCSEPKRTPNSNERKRKRTYRGQQSKKQKLSAAEHGALRGRGRPATAQLSTDGGDRGPFGGRLAGTAFQPQE